MDDSPVPPSGAVNTQGGAYVAQPVNTGGGAFVGRDQYNAAQGATLIVNHALFTADYAQADEAFRSGKYAFMVNGRWTLETYRRALGDALGVAALPRGVDIARPIASVAGFYVSAKSANQKAAMTLAAVLTNADSAQLYTNQAQLLDASRV